MWTIENRLKYNRGQLRYPSDLTDAEWALVEPLIPPAKHDGRKRKVDVREAPNGLMYVLSTGCQWRYIPKDLPPKSTIYDYFDLRTYDRTLDTIRHTLYIKRRELVEREASPSACVIDSQSVKSAEPFDKLRRGPQSTRMAMMQEKRSRARSGAFSSTR
jgi:transposase